MSFDAMDDLGRAGVVLALTGGLLGFVPELERLLYAGPGWTGALATTLLAGAVLGGALLAIGGFVGLGGVVSGASGLLLAFLGPTTAGVVGLLGGVLVFFAAGRYPARDRETYPERRPSEP